jgi:hypothetical protein
MRPTMTCSEKVRVTQNYDVATARFSEAVEELQLRLGTSTRTEYERLRRASDEARVKSEQARLELEQHLAIHDC